MPLRQTAHVVASVLVALIAGWVVRGHLNTCSEAALDAVLDGGHLTLRSSCNLLLEDEKVVTGVVTIEGGRLQGIASRIFRIERDAELTIRETFLIGGAAGTGNGGAILNAGTLHLENVQFLSNSAEEGGAIYSRGSLFVEGGRFARNDAALGGAVLLLSGQATFNDVLFEDNTARLYGGAIYNVGATVGLTQSRLLRNAAPNSGAIANRGILRISDSLINRNLARSGDAGGIANGPDGELQIIRTTIAYNQARQNAAGIGNLGALYLHGVALQHNAAGDVAGGLYNYYSARATIVRSSLSNNTDQNGARRSAIVNYTERDPVGQVSARSNYWGASDGPSGTASGHGDGVYGLEASDYVPWLEQSPLSD